jgi:hypothetical protein
VNESKLHDWLEDYASMLEGVAHMSGEPNSSLLYKRADAVKRYVLDRRASNTISIPDRLLDEVLMEFEFVRKFLTSREKVHPAGLQLFDQLVGKLYVHQRKPAEQPDKEPATTLPSSLAPPPAVRGWQEAANTQEGPGPAIPARTHFDMFLSIHQLAREIVRLTDTVPVNCGSAEDFISKATRG